MGLIIIVTDSLGFPRNAENILFRETYVSLVGRSSFPIHDIVHIGRGGATAQELLEITTQAISYYGNEVTGVVCNFGIVDAAPRALLPHEIQEIDKLLGPTQPLKEVISKNHAQISMNRGYPVITSPENFRNAIAAFCSLSFRYDFVLCFIGIAPCTGKMAVQCPTFNVNQRNQYNSITRELCLKDKQRLTYIPSPIESVGISQFLLEDGHHLSAKGHRLYAKVIISWIAKDC